MTQQTRYPGIKPFETNEAHLFFGRDRDIEDLYDLISVEKLVVLFAKSGYGKSSLLNAGILPKLAAETALFVEDDDEIAPLKRTVLAVRLGNFSPERQNENGQFAQPRSPSPVETLRLKIAEKAAETPEMAFLTELTKQAAATENRSISTLWHTFKRRQTENSEFVLLFDQFEEFFSYPLAEQIEFKRQIASLLYETMPQNVRDAATNLTRAERVLLSKPMQTRIVLAIRSDRMSFLDSMKDYLPAILHKRYELKPLSPEQARQAIKQPAGIRGEFVSAPFEYTDAALNDIVIRLQNAKDTTDKKQGIEAFLLQLLCEDIENKVIRQEVIDIDGNGLPDITPAHLPNMSKLMEHYYQRKLADLGSLSRIAQRVLEDGLLAEDAATGDVRRMSVDSQALLIQFGKQGLTDDLLRALANTFLIRAEPNTTGGIGYEISHDTLLAPIANSKKERRAAEQAEADRAAAAEQAAKNAALEAQLRKEQAQKNDLENALKTARQRTFIAGLIAIIAVLAMLFAAYQYKLAKTKTAETEQALNDFNEAQKAKEILEFNGLLERVQGIRKGGNCPEKEQTEAIQKMKIQYPADTDLQDKIKAVEAELKECL
ncbi:MAG: hypothetical protein RI894_1206 [Bacteroidota bacterium]|jgi:hypothetical protein